MTDVDGALDEHTKLHTTLAMAAGSASKLFGYIESDQDQVRLAVALYNEYAQATERVFRRFMDPRERQHRKLAPRLPHRVLDKREAPPQR